MFPLFHFWKYCMSEGNEISISKKYLYTMSTTLLIIIGKIWDST